MTRILLPLMALFLLACTPTVKVEVGSKEPITINLNVHIEHEIKLRVEKELESLFEEESELFF